MHELFNINHHDINILIETISLHIGYFILIYQVYIISQSLIKSIVFWGILVWITGLYFNLSINLGLLFGLLLSILTCWSLKIAKNNLFYIQLYYFIVQPLYFYFLIPLYILQTKYPVGVVLTFIIWLGFNLLFNFTERTYVQQFFIFFPITLAFFLLFWFIHYDHYWIIIFIVCLVQTLLLMILNQILFNKK